ncbi:MAG TPA: VIT domain-containing protein [Abditibacteriaceae bacterium]|nr:VIT domain-containing protein [Abditibacteriaceae bacterium]
MNRFTPRVALITGGVFCTVALGVLLLNSVADASRAEEAPTSKQAPKRLAQSVIRRERRPIFVPPIPTPRPWPTPSATQSALQLVSQRAQVEISGAAAKTRLFQTFRNPTASTIEGTYLFPLPTGAAISDFAMMVGGKRVAAEILDADKARGIYEDIVRRWRDPALLEFVDRNTIRARIFPIPAGAEQKVEIEYSQPLSSDGGAFRYTLPGRLPVGGAAQNATVEIRVLNAQSVRNVYSPSHAIDNRTDKSGLRISGEWKQTEDARDFVLYLTQSTNRVGVNLVTQRVSGEDGYFMMLAAPDPTLQAREIAAKDVVFTFDTSGSMEGAKIEQARKALLTLLGNLNQNDRFNIVTFSSDVRTFRPELVTSSSGNIQAARQFVQEIKAVGGTDIDEALRTSLQMFHTNLRGELRPQQLVFMTDGQPTVGETDIETILKNAEKENGGADAVKARVFVFGVGFDVNTKLLDQLAEENRGASDYVAPKEDIEAKVGSLYSKIAFPVLSNTRIDWGGADVYDVYPRQLPDLFKGSQVVVFGRYKGQSSTRIRLVGTSNGQAQNILSSGNFAATSMDNDLLPRLWATRKIGFLLDDARRKGVAPNEEVKAEVIALSKKFGIVSPLTAALITEDESPRPVPLWRDQPMPGGGGFGGATRNEARGGPSLPQSFGATSGEEAVRASKATTRMRLSDRLEVAPDDTQKTRRFVEGKTFVLQNGVWTDLAFDAKNSSRVQSIKFASPEYFALARDAKTAKWLSVGERVLVVIGNRVLRIEP